jgi:hypothetical protein
MDYDSTGKIFSRSRDNNHKKKGEAEERTDGC